MRIGSIEEKADGGRITAIAVEKTPLMTRAVVNLGDGTTVHVLPEDAARLTVGASVAQDTLDAMQRRCANRGAYLQAVRFLGPRDRSAHEVDKHLAQKGWDAPARRFARDKLQEEGYVDDRRFAHAWVAYRVRTSPRSRMALVQELKQKGIARRIIEAAVAAMDEDALALDCTRKKSRQWRRYPPEERKRRILVFLRRKGFPYDACRRAAEAFVDAGPDD